MPPTRPTPGAALEREQRIDATTRRLRSVPFSEARDLVEGLHDIADRSLAVFEQIGETHAAATRAEAAAERTEASATRTEAAVAELRDDVRDVVRRLDTELPYRAHRDMRKALPSLSEYNPDYTPAGGIKLDPDEFQKLQRHVAEQDRRAELAEAEKRGAEKAKAEALEAAAKAEAAKKKADEEREKATKDANEARERAQRRHLYWLAIASAGAGGAAWLATHFWHL